MTPRRQNGRAAAFVISALVLAACAPRSDVGATETEAATTRPSTATSTTPASTTPTTPPTTPPTTRRSPSPTESDDETPAYAPSTRARDCVGDPPPEATCYWVDVPANWSAPDGDSISLPVTVLDASDPNPAQDPIVIPAGGPGFSNSDAYGWTQAPFNTRRAIVLYDQRGTGAAEPALECPEVDGVQLANLQRAEPFDLELQAMLDAFANCRSRLEAAGTDFDDYDSEASVRDLDAIREALGHDEWNIYGASYGARLALGTMRSAPDGVRAVILDSVYDVTAGGLAQVVDAAERGYRTLADACGADDECAARHGDVAANIEAVHQRWNADPVEIEVDLDDGNGPQKFVLTGGDALAGLFNALYDDSLIPVLPSAIAAFAAGDTTLVTELVQQAIGPLTASADAMAVSVDCADNAGLDLSADAALRADPGRHTYLAADILCSEWPVQPTSLDFNEPVSSDIPSLALAGAFDPITPPASTEAAASHLANSTYLLFAEASHGVIRPGADCAESVAIDFLDAPSSPPDITCVADIPTIDFL